MSLYGYAESRGDPRISSAAITLHDHLQPWITIGRQLDRPRISGAEKWDGISYLRRDSFKEGYTDRVVELADEVSRYGRHVILDGPAELEPFVTKIVDLSGTLASLFRLTQSFNRFVGDEGRSSMAYDTSGLPDELRQLRAVP